MASSLLDWVAKVFSSRGLQVSLQFTPVSRLGHNEDISGWGTCPLGLRGGLGAGGLVRERFGISSEKVGGWRQTPTTRKAQEALHLWQVIITVLLVEHMVPRQTFCVFLVQI